MSWDWKTQLHGSGEPAEAIAQPRRDGIVFQRATPQTLSAGLAGSVPLIQDKERPCVFCGGKGHLPNGGVCPVCVGRGTIQVHPPAVRCAFCKGRGQSPPRSGLTCWVCKGKGVVPVRGPGCTCPDCHGVGRKRTETLYCSRCGGVGVVDSY